MRDLARTAVHKKSDLETVVFCQAADIRRKDLLAAELTVDKLRAEDRLAEQTGRFVSSETKKKAVTETIRHRLGQELDDSQKELDRLKTKHHLNLDDTRAAARKYADLVAK